MSVTDKGIYEYKIISVSPEGIRVKGDDVSDKLAKLAENLSNKMAMSRWRMISMVPSLRSEGAVAKLLITFERLKEPKKS